MSAMFHQLWHDYWCGGVSSKESIAEPHTEIPPCYCGATTVLLTTWIVGWVWGWHRTRGNRYECCGGIRVIPSDTYYLLTTYCVVWGATTEWCR